MDQTKEAKPIWTIGHSTRSLEEFISLLHSFRIELLADVRSLPGSRRFPHFNKESIEKSLAEEKIEYKHFPELGGRRKAKKDSTNTAWRNSAFRGYADYMESDEFKKGILKLEGLAPKKKTAIMCAEAVWWRCHRSLIADDLKHRGWKVMHILGEGKSEEHPYTSPASIVQGELNYSAEEKK